MLGTVSVVLRSLMHGTGDVANSRAKGVGHGAVKGLGVRSRREDGAGWTRGRQGPITSRNVGSISSTNSAEESARSPMARRLNRRDKRAWN